MTDTAAVDRLIDWKLAASVAGRLTGQGPAIPRWQAQQAVAELRDAAARATGHVARTAELDVGVGPPALVVDRARWVQANIEGFRALLGPPVEAAAAARSENATASRIGRRATGAEVGALMSFLAPRVLGQYDVFAGLADGGDTGRLMLVAPNVVHVERELSLDPTNFRLWVCLHEETHRIQFAAAPWLRDHLVHHIRELATDLLGVPGSMGDRLTSALRGLPDLARSRHGGTSLLDLVQTPDQRDAVARLTATMSLLEGHADVVMDDVGPQVVPTVATIRQRFTQRRAGAGPLDQLMRRLLGLEAKMRQYRDGAVFVRGVTAEVGVAGFNEVWSGPEALPSPAEIADPITWVRRVHG